MREVSLFGEDTAHEAVLTALLQRLSREYGIQLRVHPLSATGGVARLHHNFQSYLADVNKGKIFTPDLIVVATDGNCKGYTERRQEMHKVIQSHPALEDVVVYAIPDPHIERWLLADAAAFAAVLGRGCNLPQHKCEKNFYKQLLVREIQAANVKPILGGLEYAEDLIKAMDLARVEAHEASFEKLLKELKARFNQWQPSPSTQE
jgi:hypothetical protein